jgi:Rrf2 family iron-sulfur cluster assembly transcriptional regulator
LAADRKKDPMHLTTKGRYAVTAMLDLALHQANGPIRLVDISARHGISLSYLEQLFAKLRQRELVCSMRGPGGGYRLADKGLAINVAEVISAVDESIDVTRCQGVGDCHSGETCLTHHLWFDLSDRIDAFLSSIRLADLVARQDIQRVSVRLDELSETDTQNKIRINER